MDKQIWSVENVDQKMLLSRAEAISDGGVHPLTAMFGRDESVISAGNRGLSVYIVFEIPEEHRVHALKLSFAPEDTLHYPTITHIVPAAAWYEREIRDMFGICADGHPDPRPLVLHENFPAGYHPLLKSVNHDAAPRASEEKHVPQMQAANGEGLFEVPVGPIHAGIIEPGHFRFSQAGEAILQLDAQLFYTHRGLEKGMEGKSVVDALPIVERICGACSIANTWSYVQAVERIAGTDVPRRAEAIRTLLLEFERLINHVGDLGNIPAGVGFSPAISLGARTKEILMRMAEGLTGNRFLRGLIVLGGVRFDITRELRAELRTLLDVVEKNVKDIALEFSEQESFQDRVRTTGVVYYKTAVDLAMVGVGARASGVARDSRKDFVYGLYPGLDFAVAVEHTGDVAARIAVRIKEVETSLELIRHLLDLLEMDMSDTMRVPVIPRAGESYGITESARGSDFHYVALDEKGYIDRIFVRSASYANWQAIPMAVHGDIIPDFPLINKSFELCYACIDR